MSSQVTTINILKIVITTGIYPPQVGGPAQYALELSSALRASGNEVVVKTYTNELKMPILIRYAYFGLKSLFAIARADLVITLDTMSVGLPSVCIGRLVGTPVIIRTGGDFLWESYVERTGDMVLLRKFYDSSVYEEKFDDKFFLNKLSLKERAIFRLTRFTLANAIKTVFSTEWQRKIWTQPYNLDLDKTSIIENFYPQISTPVNPTRDAKGNRNEIRIVAATRPLRWKNLDMLRKVIGEIEAELRAQNDSRELVLETEILPYKENLYRLRNADMAVLVSLGDISPNMVMDALSVGCPCIVTKENGIHNRIGQYVIEVDPLDGFAIKGAIKDLINGKFGAVHNQPVSSSGSDFQHSFQHSWADIAKEFLDQINLPVKQIIAVMFSSDFNLLNKESAVFKRHSQYAKKYKTLFVGLIGRTPKKDLPWSISSNSIKGRPDYNDPNGSESPGRLVVFRSVSRLTRIIQPLVFFNVIYLMLDKIKAYIYYESISAKTPSNFSFVIICQDPFFTGLAGWYMRSFFIRKARLEIQLHTDVSSKWFINYSICNRIRALLAGFVLKRADNIRVVSNRIKEGIVAKWNIDAARINVLPITVDGDKFEKASSSLSSENYLHTKYPQWKKIVLMASRLEPEKDIVTALRAWSRVANKHQDWGLVIVGEGSQAHALKDEVKALNIERSTAFENWTNDMPVYYKSSDLFLLTSLYEGYGMTLVEASLSGTPIVSTDVGIAKELSLDKKNIITVVDIQSIDQIAEAIMKTLLVSKIN